MSHYTLAHKYRQEYMSGGEGSISKYFSWLFLINNFYLHYYVFVGYEMNMANIILYPTNAFGLIVNYGPRCMIFDSVIFD